MQSTPGQAANTRGAYPLTTPKALPWPSLQPVSPARRLHSADVMRVDTEGSFKVFPPPERREAGVANDWRTTWTRSATPPLPA